MRRLLALLTAGMVMCGCSSSAVTSAATTAAPSASASTAASITTATTASTPPTIATPTTVTGTTSAPSTAAPASTVPGTTSAPTTSAPTTSPSTTDTSSTEPLATGTPPTSTPPAGARPFDVFVPTTYSAGTPMPLVVLLHGYGATGAIQEAYFHLQPLAESKGFLYVHPDGTKDPTGRQFWNATEGCCNFGTPKIDDSAYLAGVISDVQARYDVDPKRIFVVGHSNGGFMSYRMACDHADVVAAIVSLAGATFDDPSECSPSQPVSVLEIHGNADETINYKGGQNLGNAYPSAAQTVSTWAGYDGCSTTPAASMTHLDLVTNLTGKETSEQSFAGCPPGIAVKLWTVDGGPHIPALSSTFSADIVDFLFAHPKP